MSRTEYYHVYSKIICKVVIDLNKQEFSRRLAALRINKGVSARDMSLSIGQSAGYINNIENGINLPSMQAFFYICEYLKITPKEFFDTDTVNPMTISELTEAAKGLSSDQLRNLISLAKGLR